MHGPPVQSDVAAANRAVLAVGAMILAHMVMNRGGECKTERGLVNMGSRHGMAKVGRQGMAKQGRCRRTQPADEMAGTGLEAKTPADDPTGTGLAVKQPADEVGQPLP